MPRSRSVEPYRSQYKSPCRRCVAPYLSQYKLPRSRCVAPYQSQYKSPCSRCQYQNTLSRGPVPKRRVDEYHSGE
eukprot:1250737-Rhodomonas_salina.1